MAEIRRLQQQQVFNKPIGVVTPSNVSVKAGQDLANLGTRMMQSYFEKEVAVQKQKGVDAARGFAVRDAETQEIQFRQLPNSLSNIAKKEAQPLIDKKYQTALLADMKKEAAKLRADHDKDPEGFDTAYSAYIKKTSELVDDRYRAFTIDLGSELAGQNTAAIYADKVDADDAADFKNAYNLIIDKSKEIEAVVINGAPTGPTSVVHASYKNLEREIDELVAEHGDRLSVTGAPELRKAIRRQYGGALANAVAGKLQALPEFQNVVNGSEMAANVINGLEIAYRTGKTDDLEPYVLQTLKKAGFREDMLSPDFLTAEDRRIIAGDISVLENAMQEQLQATAKQRQAEATLITLSQGGTASKSDMNNVFALKGFDTVEDLMNRLPQILTGKDDDSRAIRNLFLNNNSDLPDVVADLFETDNLQRLANTGQLPLVMDLYQQATKRLNIDGSGVNTVQRGLSNDVVVEMNALNAYRNGVKSASFPEYFQRRGELARDPQRKDMLNMKLGKTGTKQNKITDFVTNNLGSDASAEEAAFFMQYAEDLVLMHGKEMAGKILKQSADRVFVDSKFMIGRGRSRFAPEKAFPTGTDMAVFKSHVETVLATADGDYTLGENAFLLPDPRHGSVNPIYMLVDEFKRPITNGSRPLLASGQKVIEERMRIRKQTLEEAREEMRKEFQRRLDFESRQAEEIGSPAIRGNLEFAP